jgi:hypothetical protein
LWAGDTVETRRGRKNHRLRAAFHRMPSCSR